MMTLCKMISISCHTHSDTRIWCFYNQPMKDSSSASTWIPIPLPLCFETANSSLKALSYINTAFCYCWFYLKKTHMHAHKHTANLFLTKKKLAKNKHQAQMLRLNQCISLQVALFPRCPVMLHTALSDTSIPLVACLPACRGSVC